MADGWRITNRGAAGAAATATSPAPASGGALNQVMRLRSIQARLAGTAAGTDQLVVRDGPSGTGAIIWQEDLSIAANGSDQIALSGLDLRSSPGNGLTVEFVAGVASDREDVNAQGDIVPQGYPIFGP